MYILIISTIFLQQAGAQAPAEPEPARALVDGPGFRFFKPEPPQAKPKPGLSGQAEPAHHYLKLVSTGDSHQANMAHRHIGAIRRLSCIERKSSEAPPHQVVCSEDGVLELHTLRLAAS